MKNKEMPKFEAMAKVLKAMAHPTRLFIINELSHRERCVCELTDMVGVDVSTVSKHLSVLKASGMVNSTKKGLKVVYRLKTTCCLGFFSCAKEVIETRAKNELNTVR